MAVDVQGQRLEERAVDGMVVVIQDKVLLRQRVGMVMQTSE